MCLVYVAHKFGGDQMNADAAERWCARLSQTFDAIFFAPWILLVRHWKDSGETRERGLMLDLEAVQRSDEVWFICERQGELSSGQKLEESEAKIHCVTRRYFETELLESITSTYPLNTARMMRDALRKKLNRPPTADLRTAIGNQQSAFGQQENNRPFQDHNQNDLRPPNSSRQSAVGTPSGIPQRHNRQEAISDLRPLTPDRMCQCGHKEYMHTPTPSFESRGVCAGDSCQKCHCKSFSLNSERLLKSEG